MWESESISALAAVKKVAPQLIGLHQALSLETKTSYRDLVTQVDVSIEKEIIDFLSGTKYPVLGEEGYFKNRLIPERPYWCLDPIDGTLNFIAGIPLYGTSLGLVSQEFVAGAVSLPKLQEFYYTNGESAYLNDAKLQVNEVRLANALIIDCFLGSAGDANNRAAQFQLHQALLNQARGVLRLGSVAASICFVAAGRAHGAIGRRCEIWDAAGGLAVALRAGCELWYSLEADSTKIDFIVGSPLVTQELKEMTQHSNLMELQA